MVYAFSYDGNAEKQMLKIKDKEINNFSYFVKYTLLNVEVTNDSMCSTKYI